MDNVQLLVYQAENENVSVDVVLKNDTMWATQKAMANLFQVKTPAISKHIKHILEEGELQADATISKMETVVNRGIRGEVPDEVVFYNLDMIIAVGYRVNSLRATRFRQWATSVLHDYIQKGFAIDDQRMKQGGQLFGQDYFREMLERVRSIRTSERRIWQQITDIYAECSIDYDKDSPTTHDFYAMIQNSFHYAICGQTVAEIVYDRADSAKEYMGLTTWKNAPNGRILKSDVSIAKNYLDAQSIRRLERAVSGYFDYIEDLIENEQVFTMEQFAASVTAFLQFRKFQVLPSNYKGLVSHEEVQHKAEAEYDKFNRTQRIESDFDKAIKQLKMFEKN